MFQMVPCIERAASYAYHEKTQYTRFIFRYQTFFDKIEVVVFLQTTCIIKAENSIIDRNSQDKNGTSSQDIIMIHTPNERPALVLQVFLNKSVKIRPRYTTFRSKTLN